MPTFLHPDLTAPKFAGAPDARFVPAPADGVLPEGFFSTTNLPTYVRIKGEWMMPREPRMDGALMLAGDGELWVREMRRVRKGELIAVGGIQANEDALADIKKSGKTTLHYLTDDQRKAWQVAMRPTYKWAKGRVGGEVLDLLAKELKIQMN